MNRQTFYYHFQDIYALLEWIYTTDAQRLLEGKRDGDTWQQGFLQVLEYIRDNRALVRNTYHSVSRELLEGYLYRVTYQLMRDVVEERAAGPRSRRRTGLPGPLLQVRLCGADGGVDAGGHEGGARQAGEPGHTVMEGNIAAALERMARRKEP